MAKFKIGDKVIEKKTGDEYTIDGFTCCPGCGEPCVYVKEIDHEGNMSHPICGFSGSITERAFYCARLFEKPISLSSCIEYKLSVTVKELQPQRILEEMKNLS